MSRNAAKRYYTVQPGDPRTEFITPQDAQDAIDVIYDDMEQGTTLARTEALAARGAAMAAAHEASAALNLGGEAKQSVETLQAEVDGVRDVAVAALQASGACVPLQTIKEAAANAADFDAFKAAIAAW